MEEPCFCEISGLKGLVDYPLLLGIRETKFGQWVQFGAPQSHKVILFSPVLAQVRGSVTLPHRGRPVCPQLVIPQQLSGKGMALGPSGICSLQSSVTEDSSRAIKLTQLLYVLKLEVGSQLFLEK